jgi:RNase H-fold protein (predicted Holliday junction resolvase)
MKFLITTIKIILAISIIIGILISSMVTMVIGFPICFISGKTYKTLMREITDNLNQQIDQNIKFIDGNQETD